MTRASPKMDEFAALLAAEFTVKQASERMGVPTRRGERYLEDIRHKLGWQAQ